MLIYSCRSYEVSSENSIHLSKITFDLDQLDENGLIGLSDGKVSVDYEFCIPNDKKYIKIILNIDSSLNIQNSHGRSNCYNDHILVIGSTGNKKYKKVLFKIAKLDFVRKIKRTFWE